MTVWWMSAFSSFRSPSPFNIEALDRLSLSTKVAFGGSLQLLDQVHTTCRLAQLALASAP